MFDDLRLIPKILVRPSKFFASLGEQPMGELYKFWVQISLLNSVILFLVSFLSMSKLKETVDLFLTYFGVVSPFSSALGIVIFNLISAILSFIFMITVGFLIPIISACILHVCVYILGGRGYMKTLTISVISMTPSMVLSSLPIPAFIVPLYSLVLQVIGIKKLHNFSTLRAIVAILLPLLLIFLILGPIILFGTVWKLGTFNPASTVPCSPCFAYFAYVDHEGGRMTLRNGAQSINVTDVTGGRLEGGLNRLFDPGEYVIITDVVESDSVDITINYINTASGFSKTDMAVIHN